MSSVVTPKPGFPHMSSLGSPNSSEEDVFSLASLCTGGMTPGGRKSLPQGHAEPVPWEVHTDPVASCYHANPGLWDGGGAEESAFLSSSRVGVLLLPGPDSDERGTGQPGLKSRNCLSAGPIVISLLESKRSVPKRSLQRGFPENTRASGMFAEQRKEKPPWMNLRYPGHLASL